MVAYVDRGTKDYEGSITWDLLRREGVCTVYGVRFPEHRVGIYSGQCVRCGLPMSMADVSKRLDELFGRSIESI